MEQQFLWANEERRLNVKLLSEIDNVVPRAREIGHDKLGISHT